MAYIEVDEIEMATMIHATGVNKSINFKFGRSGVAIDSKDEYAVSLLEEIRDEKELSEWHESFDVGE